jgi:hypothetical protein
MKSTLMSTLYILVKTGWPNSCSYLLCLSILAGWVAILFGLRIGNINLGFGASLERQVHARLADCAQFSKPARKQAIRDGWDLIFLVAKGSKESDTAGPLNLIVLARIDVIHSRHIIGV